jgi:two-component system cell cycle response regulator DivK
MGSFYLSEIVFLYAIFTAKCRRMVTPGRKMPGRRIWRWLAPFVLLLRSMRNTAKKILIVDGNDSSRESLRGLIKGLGHEVFEATTGPEAIERASSIHPDLIMMELWLPEMSGDEATKRLKSKISTQNIPVVINTGWTTAYNVEERTDRALNAGAAEILYKPFYLPMLRDVLRSYLLA